MRTVSSSLIVLFLQVSTVSNFALIPLVARLGRGRLEDSFLGLEHLSRIDTREREHMGSLWPCDLRFEVIARREYLLLHKVHYIKSSL